MSIRIKPYYCPKCRSFKRWYGVTDTDYSIYHYCKSCGTECYDTEVLLETMISAKATAFWKEDKRREKERRCGKVQ